MGALGVEEVIGHGSEKSAVRMNGTVVFVETVAQANLLVARGLNVGGTFQEVLPLSRPGKKVILSNEQTGKWGG